MRRYLRLYLYFLRFSFSRAMEFRVDFFFRVVMDTMFYVLGLTFFTVLYRHGDQLVEWDLDQVYIFISGFFLVDALHMTVFANNMWMFPFLINRGDLDYHLVRPVSTLFFVSLREFAANSFLNVIIAGGVLAWALARYPADLGGGRIALYVLLLVNGTILYWILNLVFLIPTFWMHSALGLRQLSLGVQTFAERPHQIYRGWVRVTLLSILPFGLIASVPAQVLFEGLTPKHAIHITTVVVGAFAFVLFLWRRGLRAYSSASS